MTNELLYVLLYKFKQKYMKNVYYIVIIKKELL